MENIITTRLCLLAKMTQSYFWRVYSWFFVSVMAVIVVFLRILYENTILRLYIQYILGGTCMKPFRFYIITLSEICNIFYYNDKNYRICSLFVYFIFLFYFFFNLSRVIICKIWSSNILLLVILVLRIPPFPKMWDNTILWLRSTHQLPAFTINILSVTLM